ncbi:MAG: DeoR/GlpR family DNA-binding transcription regulator [Parvibaculaceae bacterium]
MDENERHHLILDALKERPFATVKDLLDILDVSPATIRRDIAKLHDQGAVRKVFGGIATAAERRDAPDRLSALPFSENQMLAVEAKRAIAREAEALVHDGDALIIHGGSTCYLFATRLARRNVKIFTNSMPLAARLWEGVCHLTLAGGELYREPGILYSEKTGEPDFYASKLFLGAQGIGPNGAMESHPLIVRESLRLMTRADEVVLLADSRKFSIRARHEVIPLSRIGTLITDDGLSDEHAKMLADAGVRTIIAKRNREDAQS